MLAVVLVGGAACGGRTHAGAHPSADGGAAGGGGQRGSGGLDSGGTRGSGRTGGLDGTAGIGGLGGTAGTAAIAGTGGVGSGPPDAGSDAAAGAVATGVGGAAGSGGQPPKVDGGTPAKQWSCPSGPYPLPQPGPARPVCGTFPFKYNWNEGPTWIAKQGSFFFSNFVIKAAGPGDMIKLTPSTGTCETFITGNGCNGLAVAADGNIVAACQTPRALMYYDVATKQGRVLADMAGGAMLDSVNDVVVHSNGTIYFTNPIYELAGRPMGLGQAVLRIDPAGAIFVIARGPANGIALSPDETRLYVVLQGVWDLDAQGIPSNPRAFPLGGDGIAVDCAGNIYDNAGVIHNAAGQEVGTFPGGTNMAFGGVDGRTLLVLRNQMVETVQMNIPGLP